MLDDIEEMLRPDNSFDTSENSEYYVYKSMIRRRNGDLCLAHFIFYNFYASVCTLQCYLQSTCFIIL